MKSQHYPAPWSGRATKHCRSSRCPLSPPKPPPCNLCQAGGFGGCSLMPWPPLHCLGRQKRMWGSLAPPSAPGDGEVPLTGHIVPLGRVAHEVLGQGAGAGGPWGRLPVEHGLAVPGADVEGHVQRICGQKKPFWGGLLWGLFQERPFWSAARCGRSVLGCPVLGCPVQGCPIFGCPVFGCPMQGCPMQGCPVPGCPVLHTHRCRCSDATRRRWPSPAPCPSRARRGGGSPALPALLEEPGMLLRPSDPGWAGDSGVLGRSLAFLHVGAVGREFLLGAGSLFRGLWQRLLLEAESLAGHRRFPARSHGAVGHADLLEAEIW